MMNLSLNFVALFLLTFLTFYAEVVNGCTCSEMSVADIFCMSDFVIEMEVEDVGYMEHMSRHIYQIKILETYKATDKANDALKVNLITSYSINDMCSIALTRRSVETIGGRIIDGQPNISECFSILLNSDAINLRDFIPKNCSSSQGMARIE
ncbi:tissue inhibitor of metalloproteinase isoform X2 [Microplitis demolitor]|uniref:tissue inhibitor of metalloproteinase isoform X2 n=1 Tax=Microplitis demolitor TaxID=69319 RepID=UPI0004CD3E2B|nr:tissue inhibitor of metalloproteinase isoform X2 [Microplitis demolitor]